MLGWSHQAIVDLPLDALAAYLPNESDQTVHMDAEEFKAYKAARDQHIARTGRTLTPRQFRRGW